MPPKTIQVIFFLEKIAQIPSSIHHLHPHPITKDHVPIVARFRCRPQRGQETLRQMAKEWFWSLAGAFEGQHKSTGLAGYPSQMIHVWIIYLL